MYELISVGAMLERQAVTNPNSNFVTYVDDGTTLTFSELNARVNEVAYGLQDLGVERGSFVGLMHDNSIEFLLCSYALKKLGAVEVAINHAFRGPSLSRMINLTESPLLLVGASYLDQLNMIAEELSFLNKIVVIGAVPEGDCRVAGIAVHPFSDIVTDKRENPGIEVSDDETAYVLFTSGTTGVSKGLVLSHRYAMSTAFAMVEAYGLGASDVVYTPWPLHHFGSAVCEALPALISGGGLALRSRLSITNFLKDAREHDATWCMMMGASQKYLWDKPPSADDRNHKLRFMWGGPFPVNRARFSDRFGVETFYCYGLSDCGMLSVRAPYVEGEPTNCGKVRDDYYEVSIVDENDMELPVGRTGEIVCRPRVPGIILKSYFGMPEATLDSFRNLWFHTGDLGKFDEKGDLHFFERKKHVIKRAGENILPTEVEEVIHQFPSVRESAVLGVRNDGGEEDVIAFVQLVEGMSVDVDALSSFCHERMARWMVPSRFILLERLPRTETDKPALSELRKLLA